MNISAGFNSISKNICDYYHNTLDFAGNTASRFKELRSDISFFQKICILEKGLINLFNAARNTNQLGRLATVLDAAYVTDLTAFIPDGNFWCKPVNARTVHVNDLINKIVQAYPNECVTDSRIKAGLLEHVVNIYTLNFTNSDDQITAKASLRNEICPVLDELFQESKDADNTFTLINADTGHLLKSLQDKLNAKFAAVDNDDPRIGFDLYYHADFDTKEELAREQLGKEIAPIVKKFVEGLGDQNQGNQFGYATSEAFLTDLNKRLIKHYTAQNPDDPLINFDLPLAIGDVPLLPVTWGEWATDNLFNAVSVGTIIYYLKDWNLLDTAKWAASIGTVRGLSFVNQVNFMTAFEGVILCAFTSALIEASRKCISIYRDSDPTLGPNAKHNAPRDVAAAAAEAAFYGIGILSLTGMITKDPLIIALSLVAAKTVGSFNIAGRRFDVADTPATLGDPASPSLISRIKSAVSKFINPILQQKHVALVTEKVMFVVTKFFEFLNDVVDMQKDGFDKLYKSLLPKLKFLDNFVFEKPMLGKMRATLEWHKEIIYASKIFNSIPNWLVKNPKTGFYEVRCPLYKWNKTKECYELKLFEAKGWYQTFLDISNVFETSKFLRKNQIYGFDYFVAIGDGLANKQLSVFGYSAFVKDIPILKHVNGTPKNIPVVIASVIDMGSQLYQRYVEGDKEQFNWEGKFRFAGNVGKIGICAVDPSDNFGNTLLESCTGDAGLFKHWISQYKNRERFKAGIAAA